MTLQPMHRWNVEFHGPGQAVSNMTGDTDDKMETAKQDLRSDLHILQQQLVALVVHPLALTWW